MPDPRNEWFSMVGRPKRSKALRNPRRQSSGQQEFQPPYALLIPLLCAGPFEESIRDLDMLLVLNPKKTHAFVNRAIVLSHRGNDMQALVDLRYAAELGPSFAEAHAELCAHLLKEQQLDLAMRPRNEALRLEADLPTALLNRAVLHARAARMAEALQDLDRILRVEPGNGIAQFPDRFAA